MDTITWIDKGSLPIDLQGIDLPLLCEAKGRTYQVRCGTGGGVLSLSLEASGRVRDRVRAKGSGVICAQLQSEGSGTYINRHRGRGSGQIEFVVFTVAYAHIRQEIHGGCKGEALPMQTHAKGKGYTPLWMTYDLGLLFPYLGNFFPEVADQAPAPLPEQDQVKLHILDQVVKGVEYHGDTRVWTLIGVTYCDRPVMNLRNSPNSSYPVRHIIDPHQYKLMIGYIARLWEVRPIMVEASPPGPMTQRHLSELERQRYLR